MADGHPRFCLDAFTRMEEISSRQACQSCKRMRMYFCYDCNHFVDGIAEIAPRVQVPYKVDVIKHMKESNSKSTAVQAVLLAPDSAKLYQAEKEIPEYATRKDELGPNIVIVYPSPTAPSIADFVKLHGPINRLVFLDATWHAVGALKRLPQLKGLPCVRLGGYKTDYWRPQKGQSDECLATIEAIYYAVRENYEASQQLFGQHPAYDGKFDNLLWWFYYFRCKVPDRILNSKK